jgi:hypothetical protein
MAGIDTCGVLRRLGHSLLASLDRM